MGCMFRCKTTDIIPNKATAIPHCRKKEDNRSGISVGLGNPYCITVPSYIVSELHTVPEHNFELASHAAGRTQYVYLYGVEEQI